ncbi:MAG TPA: type VI secretion system tube protein Hcp [Polyangiaceae bacterium]|nr:type VI secretion system tube protein Hcp [Polyangiaceae bacterium]
MAVNIHLKLAGIDGESATKGYEKQLEVLSWQVGVTQTASAHFAEGSGTGKCDISDLTITKYVDKSSPILFGHSASGKHIASGQLTLKKAGGDESVIYMTIDMEDVIVSAYNVGGTPSDDRIVETVTLNFGKVHMAYKPQDKKGAGGADIKAGWNIPQNATWSK